LLEYALEVGIWQIGTEYFEDRGRPWFSDDGTELHTHRLGRVGLPTQNGGEIADNLSIDGGDLHLNAYHAAVSTPATVGIQGLSLRIRHNSPPAH
jgi:hypothetical protein